MNPARVGAGLQTGPSSVLAGLHTCSARARVVAGLQTGSDNPHQPGART